MNQAQHRTSIFLMTVSLVLLAVFLFLFLKKTWQDEVAALKKETGYLFVNSIRGIESEMLDRLILEGLPGNADSVRRVMLSNTTGLKEDSIEVVAFYDNPEEVTEERSDFQIKVRKSGQALGVSEIEGALSVIVAMNGEHVWQDSSLKIETRIELLPKLKAQFDTAMRTARLPVRYKVVSLSPDSPGRHAVLSEGRYSDLASGEEYGVELSGYGAFVFQKIGLQVLFSIVLFGCVALAFFTVFKNLQRQQRLTELKNDFIQNVTHELKTPIATVGVAIEALQGFDALKDPARTSEYLDISKNELGRLSLLVDKVLRMSLFEQKEPELKLEPVDFQELVKQILASMRLQFEKQNAQTEVGFHGENFTLQGDRVHLSSVIYNLLDNALKYSAQSPVLQLEVCSLAEAVELKVSDEGVGISKENQEKVFEKFFRVPSGQVHDVKGHGLGLSYVASVVKKHGGTIGVESEKGRGTMFTVRLPKHSKT